MKHLVAEASCETMLGAPWESVLRIHADLLYRALPSFRALVASSILAFVIMEDIVSDCESAGGLSYQSLAVIPRRGSFQVPLLENGLDASLAAD